MSEQASILIVDDSTDSRLILTALLEDNFHITEVDSGEACLQQIEKQMPDLLLLDVNMQGISGYEVCTQLRKQEASSQLPIIFVSALETVEERLQGYEAGGDGYIIKPVDGTQLLAKISSCLNMHQKLDQAKSEASEAMKIAMEAMTVSSELGQIIGFIKTLDRVDSLEGVGQSVLEASQGFSLEVSLMVSTQTSKAYIGCAAHSMESQVLDRAALMEGRIISVGVHTVVRNDHVTLLIKNMPHDNENLYGRLKDHLAVLMDMADSHIVAIDALMQLGRQRKAFIRQIIVVAESQIKKTSKKLHEHEVNSRKIIESMVSGLESMLFSLGLEDDQEEKLMALADQTSLKLREASKETRDLDNEVGVILEKLYEFMEREA